MPTFRCEVKGCVALGVLGVGSCPTLEEEARQCRPPVSGGVVKRGEALVVNGVKGVGSLRLHHEIPVRTFSNAKKNFHHFRCFLVT